MKPTTIQIKHGLSPRFADVLYQGKNGRVRDNICDVLDGKTRATKDVKKFANEWLNAFTS